MSGIIDSGDVSWGDPDYDFMYLFVDYGSAFTEEVARRYQHTDIEQLRLKLSYFGIVDQIGTILDGEGLARRTDRGSLGPTAGASRKDIGIRGSFAVASAYVVDRRNEPKCCSRTCASPSACY